jgi:hypothetical protein
VVWLVDGLIISVEGTSILFTRLGKENSMCFEITSKPPTRIEIRFLEYARIIYSAVLMAFGAAILFRVWIWAGLTPTESGVFALSYVAIVIDESLLYKKRFPGKFDLPNGTWAAVISWCWILIVTYFLPVILVLAIIRNSIDCIRWGTSFRNMLYMVLHDDWYPAVEFSVLGLAFAVFMFV